MVKRPSLRYATAWQARLAAVLAAFWAVFLWTNISYAALDGLAPTGGSAASIKADADLEYGEFLKRSGVRSVTVGGTADAIEVTSVNIAVTGLSDGLGSDFTATGTNTGAVTYKLDGTAATTLRRADGTALVADDIQSGTRYRVVYHDASSQWRLRWAVQAAELRNVAAGNIAATNVQTALNELDTEKQPLDSDLTAIAALTTAAYGRDLLAVANEAALKALINAEAGVDFQAFDAELAALAGLTSAANKGMTFTGAGTAAVYDLSAFALTFLDDAAAVNVRSTLGLIIGTDVQAHDAELLAIAGLTSAADKGVYFTGAATAGVYDLSSFARTYLDDANEATLKATLNIEAGVDFQGFDATLAGLAAYNTNGLLTQTAADTFTGRSLTAGAGAAVINGDGVSGNPTIAFDYSDLGASPALAADACQFTSNATVGRFLVCEGDTADAFETGLFVIDPTADRVVTVPDADSNTVQPNTCGGTDKISGISSLGVVTCTADAGGAGSGDNGTVNGAAVSDFDLDDADPAAPGGSVNVLWQLNTTPSPDSVSAYVPTSTFAMLAAANTFTASQDVELSDDGAVVGPVLQLRRVSASPAANDVLGTFAYQGKDSGGNNTGYSQFFTTIIDPTNGSEDGLLTFRTFVAGAGTDQLRLSDGVFTPTATDGAKGTGTVNATEYYKNGVAATRTLICTLTTTSGTTASCPDIPAYRELYIEVAGVSFSASVQMTLAVSDDNGSNYGTVRAIAVSTGAAGNVLYGTINVTNIQTSDSLAVAHSVTAVAATATATQLAVVMAEAGAAPAVINAIQFAGGTFDAGTIRVYGLL